MREELTLSMLHYRTVVLFLAAEVVAWSSWIRHDYKAYLVGWQRVMQGLDPWSPTRGAEYSYGLLFNLLAPLAALHSLIPKLLFVVCWLALAFWYLALTGRTGRSDEMHRRGILVLLVANPLFWIEIPIYGHFDILIAGLCVTALHVFRQGRSAQAGILLAAGTFLKFYPTVLVPLFALRNRKVDRKFVSAFLITGGLVVGAAYLLWGASMFDPLI